MAEYDKNLAVAGTHTLETKGLRKRYGRRVVVKDVSLRVKSGEVVGLLGPNGAGKTTTFYMVVGLIVADGGSIYLDGKDITHLPIYRRAHMGLTYLPQEASVFRSLTVEDNIRAILELQKNENGKPLSKTEINERLESLLDELSIQNIRTNVDIIRILKERNIGVLITDHNVRETFKTCDHAYIISDGNVLAAGVPEELSNNETVRKIYLGEEFDYPTTGKKQ